MAQSGLHDPLNQCPLLGVKRTSEECAAMSAFDPNVWSGRGVRLDRSDRPSLTPSRSRTTLQSAVHEQDGTMSIKFCLVAVGQRETSRPPGHIG